jgi:hypothetical protein
MRWPNRHYLIFVGGVLAATGLVTPARPQDADDLQRGVARISVMEGDVSVRRGDSGEWVAGVLNAPLMANDYITTGPNSRAEVQFDSANVLRMGGSAEIRVSQLEYGRYQMELAKGTVTYRVLRPSSANVEVDTPNVSVRPSKQGVYRIYVGESGETQVIVRAGEVEVYTPRGSQWVSAGQMLLARGSASDPEFQIVNAPPPDEWDAWCDSRDRLMLNSTSYQYVGEGVYGAEDLDNYGSWVDVAPYGPVWRPTVVGADWAPYSLGRWSWLDWYGWTWVSSDPWGWAPYHYGRWFWESRWGWCWYPGRFGYRHYWSPALVAFFGFGHGGGVGFGFGHVGWVPLAPYETLHPWWGRGYYGRGFGRNVNITNVNITNVYRNARARNGISGIEAGAFQSGRFGRVSHFSGDQVRQAGMIRGQMPFAPTNASLRFSDRNLASVPRTNSNQRFFVHQQPSAVQRIPFAQQRGAGEVGRAATPGDRGGANPGGAMSRTGVDLQPSPVRGRQPESGALARGGQSPQGSGNVGGWRRFGEPRVQNIAPQNPAPHGEASTPRGGAGGRAIENTRPPQASGSGGGWQRFGAPGADPRNSGSGSNSRREYAAPNSSAPGGSAPRTYNAPAPRSYGGGGSSDRPAPRYSAPPSRSYGGGGGYSAPSPRYSAPAPAPRYSAPAPRSYGGGGSGSPRSFGGGGGSRSSGGGGYSAPAPRSYGGGGGGGSPRSFGGGGGSRSSGGGGGGGSPRSFGGGGGSRSSGGGGGHSGGGGGRGRR